MRRRQSAPRAAAARHSHFSNLDSRRQDDCRLDWIALEQPESSKTWQRAASTRRGRQAAWRPASMVISGGARRWAGWLAAPPRGGEPESLGDVQPQPPGIPAGVRTPGGAARRRGCRRAQGGGGRCFEYRPPRGPLKPLDHNCAVEIDTYVSPLRPSVFLPPPAPLRSRHSPRRQAPRPRQECPCTITWFGARAQTRGH